MKSILILALLALLPLACFAAPPPQVVSLLRVVLQNKSAFAADAFTYNNFTAYVIFSGGEIYGVILHDSKQGYYIEAGRAEIENALRAYYLSRSYSPDALSQLPDIHARILATKSSHEPGEAKCRQQTGTDVLPCNSFETCKTACLGTPFCPSFAAGGTPGEFIYVLLDFENNSILLDDAYLAENAAYLSFAGNSSEQNALAYLSALSSLNRAATHASLSPLYDGYSYCYPPDYSLSQLTSLQSAAQRAYQNASKFLFLARTSERVANRTFIVLSNSAAAETPAENASAQPSENFSAPPPSALAPVAPAAPTAPSKQDSSQGMAILVGAALAVAAIGGAAYYFSRKGKKRL